MQNAPKSLRLQIGLFGRTNVGKSSFLNMVAGQDVSIISSTPGTTTDVVEKTMELLPVGPVVFLDTAGMDDKSDLAEKRIYKSKKIFDRADIILLIVEKNIWSEFEIFICDEAEKRKIPLIIIVNKIDELISAQDFINILKTKSDKILQVSSIDKENRDNYVTLLKEYIMESCPEDFIKPPPIIGDLISKGGISILIIPIDFEAPKGRIILPQVQTIRDALDNDSAVLVVKENDLSTVLDKLKESPDLVVCDSQVVDKMVNDLPENQKCTTFSILFARYKGDLFELVKGVSIIDKLKKEDKILIAESCSHHAIEGDIGREKIPKWLKEYLGFDVKIDVYSGRDYPDNLEQYSLVIHCGSCMLTRREMLTRIYKAKQAGVPITNYGVCISYLQGVLDRVVAPFDIKVDKEERVINEC